MKTFPAACGKEQAARFFCDPRVLFVTKGRDADTIKAFAADFTAHGGDPKAVESISTDMSPAFIKGVTKHLPNARIAFDKFHVIAHASSAVDKTRRIEQKTDPSLKGLRWKLLRDRASLTPDARADLDAPIAQLTTKRTARAWLYKEQLREILARKQVNVVRDMLTQWATNVMRSKVEPINLLQAADIREYEQIDIYNVNNGERSPPTPYAARAAPASFRSMAPRRARPRPAIC